MTSTDLIPFDNPEAIVTSPTLAKFLDTTDAVLAQKRYRGEGIPYIRVGRRVFYRVKDITAYLDANTVATR